MKKDILIDPNDEFIGVGSIFGAPIQIKGLTWLPLTQLILWLILIKQSRKSQPEWGWFKRICNSAIIMPVILGSEWMHNLAHAYSAKKIQHPVDAIRINLGMPLLIYHDIEDLSLTPREHIIRSLGGPILNLILIAIGVIYRLFSRKGRIGRNIANALLGSNTFLFLAGMIPQPWVDGGAVLKWLLVENGADLKAADQKVRIANLPTAGILGVGAAISLKKKKKLIGGTFAALAGISLLTALGWLKEK